MNARPLIEQVLQGRSPQGVLAEGELQHSGGEWKGEVILSPIHVHIKFTVKPPDAKGRTFVYADVSGYPHGSWTVKILTDNVEQTIADAWALMQPHVPGDYAAEVPDTLYHRLRRAGWKS